MKKMFTLLLAAMLCILMAGCAKKVDVSGNYQLLKLESDVAPVTEENMQMLRDYGMDILLTLNADGTGTLNLLGEEFEITYDLKNKTAVLRDMQETFTYEDGQIRLADEGGTMVFVRTEE